MLQTATPTTANYDPSQATHTVDVTNLAEDNASKDEKQFLEPSASKENVPTTEPSGTKTAAGASKETDPLLTSDKNEQ